MEAYVFEQWPADDFYEGMEEILAEDLVAMVDVPYEELRTAYLLMITAISAPKGRC